MTVTITRTSALTHNVNVTLSVAGSKSFTNYTIHSNPRTPHSTRPATSIGNIVQKQPVNLPHDAITPTRIIFRPQYPAAWAQYAVESYVDNTWSFLYPLGMSAALPMIPATKPYDSILYLDPVTSLYTLLVLCDNSIIRYYRAESEYGFSFFSSSSALPNQVDAGTALKYHYGENYDGDPTSLRSVPRSLTIMMPSLTSDADYVIFLRSTLLYPLEPLLKKGVIPNDVRFISLHICTDTTIQILLASSHTVYSMVFQVDHNMFIPQSDPYPLLHVSGASIVQI